MVAKEKPAPRARQRASGSGFAGQRNGQKSYHSPRINQQFGEVAVYDGLLFAGSIKQQRGRYVALDEHGHLIGSFDRERGASSAVYKASRTGGVS